MKNKPKQKVLQMLSPENYIRQKGRSLPIYECMVNANWKESQIANVWIARRHTNGNITACIYLVDLLCLGIKDSDFFFNMPLDEYTEKTNLFKDFTTGEYIRYELAHNIIYAGLGFADDYGFLPYKEFSSVTRHFLEEDTEDIKLIEIECGSKGQPVVFQGPNDNLIKIQGIIKRLDKTAGKGNYQVVYIDDDDDDDAGETPDYKDEFEGFTLEEKYGILKDIVSDKQINKTEVELNRLVMIVDSISADLVDEDIYNEFYEMIVNELNIEIEYDEIPDQFFINAADKTIIPQEFKEHYLHVYNLTTEDTRKAQKAWKIFNKSTRKQQSVIYLELLILKLQESVKFPKLLKESVEQFPDYPLIKLLWISYQIIEGKAPEDFPEYPFRLDTFFHGRKSIHYIERSEYLFLWIAILTTDANFSKLQALYFALDDLDFSDNETSAIRSIITMVKVTVLTRQVMGKD